LRTDENEEEAVADLPENLHHLVDEPNLAYVATVMADGSPQVTPVWIERSNGHLCFNTAVGRVKERNLRRDPRVAISVANREDPYDKVDIRGRVVDMVEGQAADEMIDRLAKKYVGEDTYPWRSPEERRVLVKVEPESVNTM
jgi:PPOX class probable F420-dependent enzyme